MGSTISFLSQLLFTLVIFILGFPRVPFYAQVLMITLFLVILLHLYSEYINTENLRSKILEKFFYGVGISIMAASFYSIIVNDFSGSFQNELFAMFFGLVLLLLSALSGNQTK